jgi:broad specificity phosphatase PhoE
MSTDATIYFIRHGESEANAQNLFAGIRDNSHLTEKGRAQAATAATYILQENLRISHIVSSPLDRTRQTAAIIAEGIGFDPEAIIWEKRIAEYDMGTLTGTPIHPITSREITQHEEAEDPHMFRRRIEQAIAEARQLGGVVLLVSHAGTGRMIQAMEQGVDPMHFYDLTGFKNCELVKL